MSLRMYRSAVKKRQQKGNSFNSSQIVTYEYWAKVLRVVDGDTIDLQVSLGFDSYIDKRCRLFGVDAPEYYSSRKNTPEKKAGKASKDWLAKKLPKHHWLEIRIFSDSPHDKYGRWLVELFDKKKNLNESLVKAGHAKFHII